MVLQNSNFPIGVVNQVIGRSFALKGDDIDTDRIIPARFLKCVSFESLGKSVFADDRIQLNGLHPFDLPQNQGSKILIVNENFGCGSSREHAPQALMRWGIRAIIGQSFAEIFYGNCLALGIPCATSSISTIQEIQESVTMKYEQIYNLDLQKESLISPAGNWRIKLEQGPREMLLNGSWDVTSQLISKNKELQNAKLNIPYLNNFNIDAKPKERSY